MANMCQNAHLEILLERWGRWAPLYMNGSKVHITEVNENVLPYETGPTPKAAKLISSRNLPESPGTAHPEWMWRLLAVPGGLAV